MIKERVTEDGETTSPSYYSLRMRVGQSGRLMKISRNPANVVVADVSGQNGLVRRLKCLVGSIRSSALPRILAVSLRRGQRSRGRAVVPRRIALESALCRREYMLRCVIVRRGGESHAALVRGSPGKWRLFRGTSRRRVRTAEATRLVQRQSSLLLYTVQDKVLLG